MTSFLSHAKINLGLQVLNKREDDYHNIQSCFIEIDLEDTLDFSQSSSFQLSAEGADIPVDDSNLISKASSKSMIDSGILKSTYSQLPIGPTKSEYYQFACYQGILLDKQKVSQNELSTIQITISTERRTITVITRVQMIANNIFRFPLAPDRLTCHVEIQFVHSVALSFHRFYWQPQVCRFRNTGINRGSPRCCWN